MTNKQRPSPGAIRIAIFEVLKSRRDTMQTGLLIEDALKRLSMADGDIDAFIERRALDELFGLFRAGLVSFGRSVSDCSLAWCYLTERGRETDNDLSRDPYNQHGYLNEVNQSIAHNPAALSYVVEGLSAFNAGLNRASTVLLGIATEGLLLDLRDAMVEKINLSGAKPSKELEGWTIKIISDAMEAEFRSRKKLLGKPLDDHFDTIWRHIGTIRLARNAAGHPTDIDSVTASAAHGGYLYFQDVARLLFELRQWVINNL